jgi:hypothetical protein
MRNLMPDNPFETVPFQIASGAVIQTLKHQGQDCFLGGVHADTESLGPNVPAEMQFMKDHRNNFYRHWMIPYYLYRTTDGRKNSPFKFASGKWDLAAYNNVYFTRLKTMLDLARRHGVIVQLTLFDNSGLRADMRGTPTEPDLRWSVNPWNASSTPTHPPNNINGVINKADSGLPDFITTATLGSKLANLQNAYVAKVVRETREFPNVIYEIMNESVNFSDHNLAVWANTIMSVIAPLVQGRRLVFYNPHNGFGINLPARGKDVKDWKANAATLTAYDCLDGVILHGDPRLYDPAQFDANGWNWAHDKVLQASSDAYGGPRNEYNWNKETTNILFGRKQVYQAEAAGDPAANGIRDASPLKTTIFKLAPFLGCWDKTSTAAPHFNLRFDGKNRFVGFEPVNNQILVQGKLVSFDDTTFTLLSDGQTESRTYTYSLSPDRQTLTYTRGTLTQVFVRMPFDYEPFLFGWQKFFESTPSPFPNFLLYFGRKGTDLVTTLRDPANPATIIDQGKVLEIHPEVFLPQAKISADAGFPTGRIYNYDFYYDAQRQPCLMLVNIANKRRQDFRRII